MKHRELRKSGRDGRVGICRQDGGGTTTYSYDGAQVVAEYDNGVTKARQCKLPDKA